MDQYRDFSEESYLHSLDFIEKNGLGIKVYPIS